MSKFNIPDKANFLRDHLPQGERKEPLMMDLVLQEDDFFRRHPHLERKDPEFLGQYLMRLTKKSCQQQVLRTLDQQDRNFLDIWLDDLSIVVEMYSLHWDRTQERAIDYINRMSPYFEEMPTTPCPRAERMLYQHLDGIQYRIAASTSAPNDPRLRPSVKIYGNFPTQTH